MNRLITQLLIGIVTVLSVLAAPIAFASSPVTVLTNLKITGPGIPQVSGWTFGGKGLSVAQTTPPVSGDASYALEGQYPAVGHSGETSAFANFNVSALHLESVYIDFWAKMPDAKEGLKFCKIFGERDDPVGYANTTILTDYTGVNQGGIIMVGFGDGTNTVNDIQNPIFLNGKSRSAIGRSFGKAEVLTPQMHIWSSSNWGTSWHHFRIHIKFNSGTTASNEVPNGEVYLQIDGKVYVDATGLYNRNPGNGPIKFIQLFGWAQTDPKPFDVLFDNVVISTGGFVSDPPPAGVPESVK